MVLDPFLCALSLEAKIEQTPILVCHITVNLSEVCLSFRSSKPHGSPPALTQMDIRDHLPAFCILEF